MFLDPINLVHTVIVVPVRASYVWSATVPVASQLDCNGDIPPEIIPHIRIRVMSTGCCKLTYSLSLFCPLPFSLLPDVVTIERSSLDMVLLQHSGSQMSQLHVSGAAAARVNQKVK